MPNYRLDIAYDGSGFRGYAAQAGQRTVQGELERALATVVKEPVETVVAGRTDAGVHARGQVVSFRTNTIIDTEKTRRSLNGVLGLEIAVMALRPVDDDFDARHSAVWRRYRYSMGTGVAQDPLSRHFVWYVDVRLDLGAMRSAAAHFLGEHDFSSFCRSVSGRSNRRDVTELTLEEAGRDLLVVWVQANAFCHQMVRSVVGHLYDVGRGFASAELTREVIDAGDRSRVATVAPPHGLVLWKVGYRDDHPDAVPS